MMFDFDGKHVLIGVTGGIAAYKAAHLIRLFVKQGAVVKVIMTRGAKDFITPLTLSTLSKNPVVSDFVDDDDTWSNHVGLAKWADILCIAPATANTIAKMASGQCDSFLLAVYLSSRCPVFVAPAMDLDMYNHPAVRHALTEIQTHGARIIPAESGELASGLWGEGRMAEPAHILNFMKGDLADEPKLAGKKVLITAGPTYEAIDPVRFIGNYSSGKMGFAIAEMTRRHGAEVVLVTGPTHLDDPVGVKIEHITTAEEMFEAVEKHFNNADIFIAAAAVSDYRPGTRAPQKIKKTQGKLSIELESTTDILKYFGERKKNRIVIGFALETENGIANATEKLRKKHLDMIVLNSPNDKDSGFGTETNKVTFIRKEGVKPLPLMTKREVASEIVTETARLLQERNIG